MIKNEMTLDQILKREKDIKRELLMLELKKEEISFKTKKNEILKLLKKLPPLIENKVEYKKLRKICIFCGDGIDNKGAYKGKFYCSTSCKRKDWYQKIEKPRRDKIRANKEGHLKKGS